MSDRRKRFEEETRRELFQQTEAQRWIEFRKETIISRVSAHDVLRRNGVRLKQGGDDREEQFSCPFHGKDHKPSARVYPETVRGPSHVWCFVCQKRWDVIGLWRKYSGEDTRFTQILSEIERTFGIIPPDRPPRDTGPIDEADDEALLSVYQRFEACEKRLKQEQVAFDMKTHLMLGSILDQLYYQVEERKVSTEKATEVLQKVIDKIGEKVRCHVG